MGTSNDGVVGTTVGLFDILYECDFKSNDGHRMFHVRCKECGWETDMKFSDIKRRIGKQCKHVNSNGRCINRNYKWTNQRIGSIFKGMKNRCYNPNNKDFRWYGAKGIKICDEWLNDPKLFEDWSLLNGYNDNLTIDRINETKDYCPENCRWVTRENNSKNKPTTNFLEVNGAKHTGREWSEILGLSTNAINKYVKKYGEINTTEFIKRYLDHPGRKPKRNQSIYDLYMNH